MGRYKIEERGEVHTDMRVGRGGWFKSNNQEIKCAWRLERECNHENPHRPVSKGKRKKTAATK